jgi:3,4-dihydroxy-2-butanone 4-phosphate synthase
MGIAKAIEAFKQGKMIIIADDVDRENEGDIVIAAEKITEETMAFMAKKASGLICLALTNELAKKNDLDLMVENNQESMKTAFTVSIDAKHGITTGISAADRVKTVLTAIDNNASSSDIVKPGHMFPVVAKSGGVLERRGHTEASVEMAKLAGLSPASVMCEILDDEGKMIRGKALEEFAIQHQIELLHIEEIVQFLKD